MLLLILLLLAADPVSPTVIQDVTDKPPPPPPPPPVLSARGEPCKTRVISVADPDAFYPAESRARGEQGDVIIRITGSSQAGPPVSAQIDTSSGFPELDAAGLLAIGQSKFVSNCAGYPLRLKVKFRIK
jgi:TonB family protein